jgi:8-oxo-dGTP pyrophosphatase MutT (NUDIX family)
VQEAAGYILYVMKAGVPRFLLLRNARHKTWGFPKGKLDPGEDARAGARRELLEETGVSEFHEDSTFCVESVYELPAQGDDNPEKKRVLYYLARADEARVERSSEHDAADWMSAEEVVATLQHADLKRVFREAKAHLRKTGALEQ